MNAIAQAPSVVDQFRQQLQSMEPQFRTALPSNIKPERFQRVVMTLVQTQPELLATNRRALLTECMKCAADGLVPDGREAALVIYNVKVKTDQGDRWEKQAKYMPMLGGLQKRARNSGGIAGFSVQVVYENDQFIQRPDDFEHPIEHRPPPLGNPRGRMIGAYALAKLKDGTLVPEVMDLDQIHKVMNVSRSKDKNGNMTGPWKDWFEEMSRKTVFRRLCKWLPMDAEADDLLRRDDEATLAISSSPTIDAEPEPEVPAIEAPSKLDALEGMVEEPKTTVSEPAQTEATEPPPEDTSWAVAAAARIVAECADIDSKSLLETWVKSIRPDMLRIKAEDPSRFAYVDGLIKEKWEFLAGPVQ